MCFPALAYADAEKGHDVELSPARRLRVTKAELARLSGRGAPELLVTCAAGTKEKQFAVVICLLHSLKEREREELSSAEVDVVLVDLRASLRFRKRKAGKHFDRIAIIAEYQDADFIGRLLQDTACPFKSWEINSKRAKAEADSLERKRALQAQLAKEAAERERRRLEQERAEAERRARQLAAEEEKHRVEEEERRRAEEEAERRWQTDVMELLNQQDHQVYDPKTGGG